MQNRNWLTSDSQQRQLFAGLTTSSMRKMLPTLVAWCCIVTWVLLFLSLPGCAHNSPPLCQEHKLPPTPALSEPIPQESYSLRVQRTFKSWQEKLIATPVTP